MGNASLNFQDTAFDERLPRYKSGLDTRSTKDLSFTEILIKALYHLRDIYSER